MCVLFLSLVAFTHWAAFLCTCSQSLGSSTPKELFLSALPSPLGWITVVPSLVPSSIHCWDWTVYLDTVFPNTRQWPPSISKCRQWFRGKNMNSGLVLLWALPYLSNQLIHYSVWLSAPYRMDSQCGQQGGFQWLQCTSHLQAEWFQFFVCIAACEQHALQCSVKRGGTCHSFTTLFPAVLSGQRWQPAPQLPG